MTNRLIKVCRDDETIGYASGIKKAKELAEKDAEERGKEIKWRKTK